MKQEITDILFKHLTPQNETEQSQHHDTADELTDLMCYREVRAFCFGYEGNIHHISDSIFKAFEKDYSEYEIKEAIEKYKNEPK